MNETKGRPDVYHAVLRDAKFFALSEVETAGRGGRSVIDVTDDSARARREDDEIPADNNRGHERWAHLRFSVVGPPRRRLTMLDRDSSPYRSRLTGAYRRRRAKRAR